MFVWFILLNFSRGSPHCFHLLPAPSLGKAMTWFFLGLFARAKVDISATGGIEFNLETVDVCEL